MSGDRGLGTERRDGPACRRTSGLIDRIVADTVTPADRDHAGTCGDCGPVLARAARFDDALRRTARAIAVEQLPPGILDPGLAVAPGTVRRGTALRGFQPGLAGVAAAVAILILATGIALVPGGLVNPRATPTAPTDTGLASAAPLFRPTAAIAADASVLKLACMPGGPLPTHDARPGGPEREGVVCASVNEDATKKVALITGETGAGDVVSVSIKGELVGSTIEATDALAIGFAKLTFISIADPRVAPVAGDWVDQTLRDLRVLSGGDSVTRVLGGIRFTFERNPSGDFMLRMEPFVQG